MLPRSRATWQVEETGRSLEESLSWDPHSSVQLDVHFDFGDVRTLKVRQPVLTGIQCIYIIYICMYCIGYRYSSHVAYTVESC